MVSPSIFPRGIGRFAVYLTLLGTLFIGGCNSSGGGDSDEQAADNSPAVTDNETKVAIGSCSEVESLKSVDQPSCDTRENDRVTAMWIWGSDVVLNSTSRDKLFTLAAEKDLNRLYLAAWSAFLNEQQALADFIVTANSQGIEVELLFGDPGWALHENHHYVVSIVDQVIAFAERYPEAPLAGIHLDVEPYLLPEWDHDMQSLANQFIDMLEAATARANGAALPLFADIPIWYDEHSIVRAGESRRLHQLVIDVTDGVGLMDYRDSRDRIVADALAELQYAATLEKPVTVGVETLCIEPESITFCEEGSAFMEQVLAEVDAELQQYSAYVGYAIHHFDSYLEMEL